MPNWISYVPVPRRLVLAWQAPDECGDRYRWAVGWMTERAGRLHLKYLQPGTEFEAMNSGRSYERIIKLGFGGYPGLAPSLCEHEAGVLGSMMRRLPPKNRADFTEYKAHFRLAAELPVPNLALLAHTEAKLPSDGFSIVDTFEGECEYRDLMLEVAGYRYYRDKLTYPLEVGRLVDVCVEDDNAHDAVAVMFCVDGQKIGNVNRLQAPAFRRWLSTCQIIGELERLNGTEDRPRAFIFVRVRPSVSVAA